MSLLRPSIALLSRRAAPLSVRQNLAARPISSTPVRFAQGYGDGEGDPKGENPQHQGASNNTKHNAEHPGPEPPAEGQGTGAGPTKGGKSPEDASAESGGARSKDAKETGSSPTGGSIGQGGGKDNSKGSPKIQSRSEPGGGNTVSKQAEVEKHNREFEQGHDRAPKAAEDKVDKKFWSGKC
ncbi:hypothetical protein F5882DRAFT_407897 [Hyaloscypha sp. PMI_1271]|nr:hypothetical protein F5882DRAFT_407897 [Hyaloscypha sp. PMI_1271]